MPQLLLALRFYWRVFVNDCRTHSRVSCLIRAVLVATLLILGTLSLDCALSYWGFPCLHSFLDDGVSFFSTIGRSSEVTR